MASPKLVTALLLLLAVSAGASARQLKQESAPPPTSPAPIIEAGANKYVLSDMKRVGLTYMVRILQGIGMVYDIINLDGTFFVPNNKALESFLQIPYGPKLDNFLDNLQGEDLKNFVYTLWYHIVPNEILTEQVLTQGILDNGNRTFYTYVPDQNGTAVFGSNGQDIMLVNGNTSAPDAMILSFDVISNNKSTIHIIDHVLQPGPIVPNPKASPPVFPTPPDDAIDRPDNEVIATLNSMNDTKIMAEALQITGLDRNMGQYNDTMFAPTNEAFLALISMLGTDPWEVFRDPLLIEVVRAVLQNHISPAGGNGDGDFALFSNQLTDGLKLDTWLGYPNVLTIRRDTEGNIYVVSANPRFIAEIIDPDVEVGDGVIHVINKVLVPLTQTS